MRDPPDDVRLPLTALDFSILLVLTEGVSYGYGIMKAVSRRSSGALNLAPGNIYQALDRLLSRGWIRELGSGEVPEDADSRRRYYGVTPDGAAAMAAEARRLRDMLPALERALDLRQGEA